MEAITIPCPEGVSGEPAVVPAARAEAEWAAECGSFFAAGDDTDCCTRPASRELAWLVALPSADPALTLVVAAVAWVKADSAAAWAEAEGGSIAKATASTIPEKIHLRISPPHPDSEV